MLDKNRARANAGCGTVKPVVFLVNITLPTQKSPTIRVCRYRNESRLTQVLNFVVSLDSDGIILGIYGGAFLERYIVDPPPRQEGLVDPPRSVRYDFIDPPTVAQYLAPLDVRISRRNSMHPALLIIEHTNDEVHKRECQLRLA